MRSFARQSALVFAGLLVANVLTYVFYAVVTRAVLVSDAGLFLSLISAIMVASLPAVVGGNVVAKMAADASGSGNEGVVAALGRFASALVVPCAIVVVATVALSLTSLDNFFHAADPAVIVLAAAALALALPLQVQRSVLQGAGRFGDFSISYIIEAVVKTAAGIATYVVHGGLRLALAGYVVATAAAAAFSAAPWLGGAASVRPALPRRVVTRHVVGIALPIAALSAVTFGDVVVVRHGLDATQSGLYAATALFGRALLTVLQFVPTVLMTRAVAERAAGRSPARLLGAALLVTGGAVAIALLAARLVPRELLAMIAGTAFVGAASLMVPYTAAMGALAAATVVSAYLIGVDRTAFAIGLIVVAALELTAIAVYHPSALAVVHVVLVGHCALLACCIPDALLSIKLGNVPRRSEGLSQ